MNFCAFYSLQPLVAGALRLGLWGGRPGHHTHQAARCAGSLLLLLFFGIPVTPVAGEGDGSPNVSEKVAQEVNSILAQMERAGRDEIWPLERKLERIGNAAAKAVKERLAGLPPVARLACAKMLGASGEAHFASEMLFELARDEKQDLEVRAAAGEILARYASIEKVSQPQEKPGQSLAERMHELAGSVKETPLKTAFAKVLWNIGEKEEHQARAYDILMALLHSKEYRDQVDAAFALAEIFGTKPLAEAAVQILQELENEPTPEGKRAAALLQLHRLIGHTVRDSQFRGKLSNPLLEELRQRIQAYYVDENLIADGYLLESAARGMVEGLDRFSSYMSRLEWESFREGMAGEYAGIGASVVSRGGRLTVEKVFYSGPAYKAGVRSNDEILEVDGASMSGKGSDDVAKGLRGEPGSQVTIKVRRRRTAEPLSFSIVREVIKIPVAYHEVLPGKIGYLRLMNFGDTATEEVQKAIDLFEDKEKISGLIFDLRDNPGGLLQAAQEIANKFLDGDKLIVFSQGRNQEIAPRQEFRTDPKVRTVQIPMVVLVNEHSASAAEIVAGALQDHKRAGLVGQKTFGKGSVQQLMPMDSTQGTSALRLTVAKYYLPSERSIHEVGIQPDLPVEARRLAEEDRAKIEKLDDSLFEDYYLDRNQQFGKILAELAEQDARDPARYPDFEAWYTSLETKPSKDAARYRLRQEIRNFVADERGKDFIIDLTEDVQLQQAIRALAKKLDLDLSPFEPYQSFEK